MGREERAKAINFISCACLFFFLSLSSDSVFPPADFFFFSVAVCVKGKESVGLLRDLHFLSLSRGTPLRCFPSSIFHLPPRCPRPPSGEASCLIRLPARLAVKMSGVFAGTYRRINGTGSSPQAWQIYVPRVLEGSVMKIAFYIGKGRIRWLTDGIGPIDSSCGKGK